ncbi:MAG: hypothetical protein KBT04_04500 [Bacteroidales bacterium]|nr:hypothetical protein [Candidatus Colimorpha onthohippi]
MPLQNRSQATSTSFSSLTCLTKAGLVVRTASYEIEDPSSRLWIAQNALG